MNRSGGVMRGLVFGILAFATLAQAFAAETLTIPLNSERDLSFDQPVSKLYIKDPRIVDAAVVDKSRVILSGKHRGATTIQAVDAAGQRVAIYRVVVGTPSRQGGAAPQYSTVTYQRGAEQIIYACGRSSCRAVSRTGVGPDGVAAATAAAANPAVGSPNAAQNAAPSADTNAGTQPAYKITVPPSISPP